MDYSARICIIANDIQKLDMAKDILFKHTEIKIIPQSKSKTSSKSGTTWYYVSEKVEDVDTPDWYGSPWRSMYKEAGKALEKKGAIIIYFEDNLWDEQGKEPEYMHHTASTPKGGMLNYNTDIAVDLYDDFEDFSDSGLPCGYEKFKAAFIKAYGAVGKEILEIYDNQ